MNITELTVKQLSEKLHGKELSSAEVTKAYFDKIDVTDEKIKSVWAQLEQLLVEKSKLLDIDYVITSSYGLASREKGEKETMDALSHRADEKMYEYKKEQKKNR